MMKIACEKFLTRNLGIITGILLLWQIVAFGNDFNQFFKLTKTIRLDPGNILIGHLFPVFADSKGNFIACDYRIGKVLLFDNNGKLIKVIADHGKGPGEVIEPVAGAIGSDDQFAIIDNAMRRVNVFDTNKKFTHAFYLNSRTQPGGRGIIYNNIIYMPTKILPDAENEAVDFIAKYHIRGHFIDSFYPKDDRLEGLAGNTLSKLVINDGKIFAIQTSIFTITVLDTSGKIIQTFGKKPGYFVSPMDLHLTLAEINNKTMSERQKTLREIYDVLTPVVGFFSIKDRVFITSNVQHGELENRVDKMEIFDLNGEHLAGNIDIEKMFFLTTGNDGYVYFVIGKEIDEKNTYYLIGQFKYIGN
jgi:hypothetical protein